MEFIQYTLMAAIWTTLIMISSSLTDLQHFEKVKRFLLGDNNKQLLAPPIPDTSLEVCIHHCVKTADCTAVSHRNIEQECSLVEMLYVLLGGPHFQANRSLTIWAERNEVPRPIPHVFVATKTSHTDYSLNSIDSPDLEMALTDWVGLKPGTAGTYWRGGFLACGGYADYDSGSTSAIKKCEILYLTPNGLNIKSKPNLNVRRTEMMSASYPGGLVFLGGENNGAYVDSIEFLQSDNTWAFGPTLVGFPQLKGACMASYELGEGSYGMIVTGGVTYNGVYPLDIHEIGLNSGPNPWFVWPNAQLSAKAYHSCASTKIPGNLNTLIVVAGGTDVTGNIQNSVYILDTGSKTVSPGPVMPQPRYYHQLVRADGLLYTLSGFDQPMNVAPLSVALDTLELSENLTEWTVISSVQILPNQYFYAKVYNDFNSP